MPSSPADWTGGPVVKPHYGPGVLAINETAKLLYALSEGPCAGFDGNAWQCIKLDGTPIMAADGTTFNMKGVSVAIVHGTVNQQSIPGFSEVEIEHSSGAEIKKSVSQSFTVSDPEVTSVRVKIGLQVFKAIDSTTGVENGTTVTMGITVNGVAQTLPGIGNAANGTITGISAGPTTVAWTIPLTGTGSKTIVISRVTDDNGGTYLLNKTYFSGYTEIKDYRLSHPHTAKLAIAYSADNFASMPKLTVIYKGVIVKVPSNYNPTTRIYTGAWDGTFVDGWSDNPVWCLYFMATHPRFGAGRYLNAAGLDKWALYEIAQYCDALVDDGHGGTEPRFRFNAYFGSDEEAFKVLAHITSTARAMLYYGGSLDRPSTSLTAIQDVDTSVRALFSPSNVVGGDFAYEGTPLKTRYTQITVWWNDPSQGYKLVPVLVQADQSYITRYGVQTAPDTTAFGATTLGQAIRKGKETLLTNLLETEVVRFSSGLAGIIAFPGEMIQIQDPNRDQKRMAGRIVSATTTSITLDNPVTLAVGTTYTAWMELADGSIVSRTITTAAGTVSTVAWSSAVASAPQAEAQWQISSATPTKWRVVGVKENKGSKTITYEIRATMVATAKYALMDDPGTIIPGVATTPALPTVSILSVTASTTWVDSVAGFVVKASWVAPAGATDAMARIRLDSGPWIPMDVSGATAIYQSRVGGTFEVQVVAIHPGGSSPAVYGSVTVANVVSNNTLSDLEKAFLIQKWNDEAQTKTQLDSQASTYSVSATDYDNAVAALSSGLIAAGAPSNWASTWPDGTTFTASGIVASLAGWWSTIASTRTALQGAINAKILANASTDATNKANAAQAAAISSAATTAMQKSAFTTDGVHIQGTTMAGGTITAAAMANSNSTNLIPNPNSDTPAPTGGWPSGAYESAGLSSATSYSGSNSRIVVGNGSAYVETALTPLIACMEGEQFYMEAMVYAYGGGAGGGYLQANFYNSSGTRVGFGKTSEVSPGSWQKITANAIAPSGTSSVQFTIGVNPSTPSGVQKAFDNILATRVIVAGMLAANSVVAGNVAAQAITAREMTLANPDNLIPNPNSEQAAPAGGWPSGAWEAVGLDTSIGYAGSSSRKITGIGSANQVNLTAPIPVASGDWICFEAMATDWGFSDHASIGIAYFSSLANYNANSSLSYVFSSGTNSGWSKLSCNLQAPSGAQFAALFLFTAQASGHTASFDNLYARRMADANLIVDGNILARHLTAVLAIVGTIKDPYYVAGSTGNAPTGFKLSGTPFTTTFIDGTTDANCHLELEGSANFGGQKVATIVNKVIGNVNTRTTAGTMDITIPAGITRVTLEGFGGCGGGGGASSGQGGGGGAAGDGRRQPVTVVPGTTYRITVGAGGTAGAIGGTGGTGGATTMAYLSGPDSGFTTITFTGGLGGTATGIGGATGLGSPGGVAATGSVVATSGVIQPAAVQSFSGVWSVPGGGGGGGGVVGVSGSNPAPGGGANGVGGGPINLTSTSGRAGGGGGGYAGNGQYGGQGGTWTVSGSIATAGTAGAPGSATLSW